MRYPGGQTALVTLNAVRYAPLPGAENDGLTEFAVIDLTIKNTSSKDLRYDPEEIAFAFADDNDPYTHEDDVRTWGTQPDEDYTPFMPPGPLRPSSIRPGTSVRGLTILRVSDRSHIVLTFAAPNLTTDLAEWALTSK